MGWQAGTRTNPIHSRVLIRRGLRFILDVSVLSVFFLGGWWLRTEAFQGAPYFLGFAITLPAVAAPLAWIALGAPGLLSSLRDHRLSFLIALAAFTGWTLLSPGWSRFPNQSSDAAAQWTLVAIFTLVVVCSPPPARWAAVALAFGLIWQSVVVVGQWFHQASIGLYWLGEYHLWPTRPAVSVVVDGLIRRMRPYGLIVHPNIIAGYLTVALLALSGWLFSHGLARWRGIVRFGVLALGLWALCLTFSRGAWGALVGGIALIVIAAFRRGFARTGRVPIALTLMVSGAVIVAFVVAYPGFILSRTTGASASVDTEEISVAQRRILNGIALNLFLAHPAEGVGIGVSDWETAQILPSLPYPGMVAEKVHNVPLLALSELGLIGFCLWAAALVVAGLTIWRVAVDPFAIGLAAGAAALVAIGLFDHYPWSIFQSCLLLWGSLALAMAPQPSRASSVNMERSAT